MEAVSAVASALIAWLVAGAALLQHFSKRRAAQLRTEEVARWAERCISALQSAYLISTLEARHRREDHAEAKAFELMFELSILVEQGRLFFKNVRCDGWGDEKPEAYRGLRPRILDCLVIAHQAMCEWKSADRLGRQKLALIINRAEQDFVSLIRYEVARDRVAATGAAEPGNDININSLMTDVSASQIDRFRWP